MLHAKLYFYLPTASSELPYLHASSATLYFDIPFPHTETNTDDSITENLPFYYSTALFAFCFSSSEFFASRKSLPTHEEIIPKFVVPNKRFLSSESPKPYRLPSSHSVSDFFLAIKTPFRENETAIHFLETPKEKIITAFR